MYRRKNGEKDEYRRKEGARAPSAPAVVRGRRMSGDRIAEIVALVSAAAAPFESRWTLRALRGVDRELHDRLVEQQGLYHEALITAHLRDLEEHAAAMVRGWRVVVARMEQAQVDDDAYLIGRCPRTGTTVAIGSARQASARVREIHGDRVIWMTPDEVAVMMGGLQGIRTVEAVKGFWPTAEIIELYPDEPAKDDAA